MSHHVTLITASLLETFRPDVAQRRRDRNHDASKSMTRFTLLLTLLFAACWFQLWIRSW